MRPPRVSNLGLFAVAPVHLRRCADDAWKPARSASGDVPESAEVPWLSVIVACPLTSASNTGKGRVDTATEMSPSLLC